MKKAIFLDRDGVINRERGEYTFRVEDFEILPGVLDFIKESCAREFIIIVITNQGGIGKKIYSNDDLYALNQLLTEQVKNNGGEITDIYFCPHFPDNSGKCICRKPDSLLFEKAMAKHDIDPHYSYMIGDKERDILPAQKLGIKTFQVESNSNLKNLLPLLV